MRENRRRETEERKRQEALRSHGCTRDRPNGVRFSRRSARYAPRAVLKATAPGSTCPVSLASPAA